MIREWFGKSVVLALACTAPAQQDEDYVRVELRVISVGPSGAVVVDRGKRDGLATGDVVFFHPRGGGSYPAGVIQVDDRTAIVEMRDRGFTPRSGTRGRVRVPKARRATPKPDAAPKPRDDPPPDGPKPDGPEHPPWENEDEEWKPGMPLLQMKPVRPRDRGMQVSGRFYSIGNLAWDDSQDFDNSSMRVGTELNLENPFGQGGGILFDGEVNYRTEQNERRGFDILPRRFSYRVGGTRFQNQRLEAGRFLQQGMPEFGVLDGVEYGIRRKNGHRFGGSIGFLPEPDDDFDSLEDLQLAGYYHWVPDNSERILVGGGFQKSFHNGRTDRDLFVVKGHYLPLEPGWNAHGTVWIDLYHGRDDEKNNGVELTQAILSTGRNFENGDGVDLTFRRIRYPEMLRTEFQPLLPGEIADTRYDRLALTGWKQWSDQTRLRGQISGYDDEQDNGGAIEVGADLQDWFGEGSLADVTMWGSLGEFSNSFGARLGYGELNDNGRWNVFYEIAHHRMAGFDDDRDDLIQHRLHGTKSMFTSGGWSVSLFAEAHLFDEELAFTAGFHVQRSFRLRRTY